MLSELDPEEEKEQQKELSERFKPLITWLKGQAHNIVRDGRSAFFIGISRISAYEVCSRHFKQACDKPLCNRRR